MEAVQTDDGLLLVTKDAAAEKSPAASPEKKSPEKAASPAKSSPEKATSPAPSPAKKADAERSPEVCQHFCL